MASVLDFDSRHHHESAEDEAVARGGLRRRRLVVDAAENRRDARDHGPVFRHADLDAAPQREDIEDGFAVAGGLPPGHLAGGARPSPRPPTPPVGSPPRKAGELFPRATPPNTAVALTCVLESPTGRRRGP